MAASWFVFLLAVCFSGIAVVAPTPQGASWCVARSNIHYEPLQPALDFACGAGADCGPIQPHGPCFLPNNIVDHASYAFNSFYQNKNRAPGSCGFAGTAIVVTSNPSFGDCVYPSSANRTVEGRVPVSSPTPTTTTPPPATAMAPSTRPTSSTRATRMIPAPPPAPPTSNPAHAPMAAPPTPPTDYKSAASLHSFSLIPFSLFSLLLL